MLSKERIEEILSNVPPTEAESGPPPSPKNSCEGSDCINYDFPFDVAVGDDA